MSEAYEVSPDDQQGVAEAIRRAAAGATVHLVRDGEPVADIVPAAPPVPDDCELTRDELDALDARAATQPADLTALIGDLADRHGAPTMAHYRSVFAAVGHPWPGAAFIRRHHPVADAG